MTTLAASPCALEAHAYARRGWHVLPLKARSKAPLGALVSRGWHDASAEPDQIDRWWRRAPGAGVGIACRPSGIAAIDVDPRHGGDDHLHDLERALGPLPRTVEVLTGGGGRHIYLRHPDQDVVAQLAPGVEVKSAGYLVAPPSVHPDGGEYRWSVDGHPLDVELAEAPPGWLERLVDREPAGAEVRSGPERRQGGDDQAADDPLLRIDARVYFPILTGREPNRQGYVRCPFHKGGQEERPDLKLYGPRWACFACPRVRAGGRRAGGSIYTLAALVWGYPLPLRGPAFLQVSDRLCDVLQKHYERRMAAA